MAQELERIWRESLGEGRTRAERRPCRYRAYLPDRLSDLDLVLPAEVAADVGDAERAIVRLNAETSSLASLEAVARLLLRAESVASSRIEGLQVGPRRLVRAEVARDLGLPIEDPTAEAVLGNVEAMALAVDGVASAPRLSVEDILAIHRALMRHTDRPDLGGVVRTSQNWIGGNDYNPCGAAFVPPPPEEVPGLLDDLVAFLGDDCHSPLVGHLCWRLP